MTTRSAATSLRRHLAILVLLAGLILSVSSPAQAGRAPEALAGAQSQDEVRATTVGESAGTYRQRLVYRTYRVRRHRGIPRLGQDACLNAAARRWAVILAEQNRFAHQNLRSVMDRCNLRGVGENLALGYTVANRTVSAWMDSPGHRANLLNRRFRRIGTGVAQGPRGRVTVQLMGWR